MVILIVDENRVLAFKGESQTPIAVDFHAAVSLEIAAQGVQFPSWSTHVARGLGPIQLKELEREVGSVCGLNSRFASGGEELLDSAMPEALDHAYSVARHFSLVEQAAAAPAGVPGAPSFASF